ncbi:MAG: MFS transporter [Sulfobacillus sp.]|nr:MFS transporter [Sulfobacillus sp.]
MTSSRRAFWAVLVANTVVQSGWGAILPILPLFVREHGMPLGWMGVMASGFAAISFVAQLGFGRLSDIWGRKPLLVAGAVWEAVGTLAFVGSWPWPFYIVWRLVQGVGAGAFMPAANALVADLVPEAERGRAYGLLYASSSAGFTVGPLIGGLLGASGHLSRPFWAGAGLNTLAAFALVNWLPRHRPGRPAARPSRRASAFWSAWIRKLWPPFLLTFSLTGLSGMYDATWSLYMRGLGASNWVIGLSFSLFSLPLLLFSLWNGRLADRPGERRRWVLAGALLQTAIVVFYIVSRWAWASIAASVLEALAISLSGPALTTMVMESAPPDARGQVQGWFQASGTLGATVLALVSGLLLPYGTTRPFVAGAAWLLGVTVVIGWRWRGHPPAESAAGPHPGG